jgi:hypothetical protein
LSTDITEKKFVPILEELAGDKVPNVRLNVARALGKSPTSFKGSDSVIKLLIFKAKEILKTLSKDKDFDVSYYAKKAIVSF